MKHLVTSGLCAVTLAACVPATPAPCTADVAPDVKIRAEAAVRSAVGPALDEKFEPPQFRQCGDDVTVSLYPKDINGMPMLGGDAAYTVAMTSGQIIKTVIGE